jgi:hypothetical protein
MGPTGLEWLKSETLQQAAKDFRYLLNRGYSRRAALELVGNRYQLAADQRHLLHRGVYSHTDSESRQQKRIPIETITNRDLAIDGHNVLITIEAGLEERPLILGDDGFIRDISGLSGSFKKSEATDDALRLILKIIKRVKPRRTLFLFDSPISMSGNLAEGVRRLLIREDLLGDAKAVRVPEQILIGFPGVVATSDTAIIDQSKKVVDLAGEILKRSGKMRSLIRLKKRQGCL